MSRTPATVRDADTIVAEERGAVSPLLEANADRREAAEAELSSAKLELQELLIRGQAAGIPVAEMSRKGRISRDTSHRILKEAGEMTWKQKEAWASDVLGMIPRGDHDQNQFRALANMTLLKALGKNPEGLPRSVSGVLDHAANVMKASGSPSFEPEYDPTLPSVAWPR